MQKRRSWLSAGKSRRPDILICKIVQALKEAWKFDGSDEAFKHDLVIDDLMVR